MSSLNVIVCDNCEARWENGTELQKGARILTLAQLRGGQCLKYDICEDCVAKLTAALPEVMRRYESAHRVANHAGLGEHQGAAGNGPQFGGG